MWRVVVWVGRWRCGHWRSWCSFPGFSRAVVGCCVVGMLVVLVRIQLSVLAAYIYLTHRGRSSVRATHSILWKLYIYYSLERTLFHFCLLASFCLFLSCTLLILLITPSLSFVDSYHGGAAEEVPHCDAATFPERWVCWSVVVLVGSWNDWQWWPCTHPHPMAPGLSLLAQTISAAAEHVLLNYSLKHKLSLEQAQQLLADILERASATQRYVHVCWWITGVRMGCRACRRDQRSWLLQFLIPQGSPTLVVSGNSLWTKNTGKFFFLLVQAGKQQPCFALPCSSWRTLPIICCCCEAVDVGFMYYQRMVAL